jgi:hypothetical protein
MPAELLHVVGYLTGAALYAMLLAMAVRDRASDRLTLGTALLGLGWNVGELLVYTARGLDSRAAEPWLSAASFAALGFLAAVVVHSVSRGSLDDTPRRVVFARTLTAIAYGCAALAGVIHLWAAAVGRPVPAPPALTLLTIGLLALAPALVIATRRQANERRAIWMTALAVFAVSALHLGNFHGAHESFAAELLGHHASIPLAFAILYQDYRFALADLFLKQALTLLAVVAMVFGCWSLAGPALAADPSAPRAIGLLLVLWVATTLVFPWIRTAVARFVDRVVLVRANYSTLLDDAAALVQRCSAEEDVLNRTCEILTSALSATAVSWEPRRLSASDRFAPTDVPVFTADAPQYVLVVGRLAGGRRLLSDDLSMLERVAFLASRRIDALRLTNERYERMLREREMGALATEAELKALRAQINPHFLFNALTTVGYLIQAAPARALDTLIRLTTLLRGVLRSDGEFTTLGRERELIECYLQIERERFEERLTVRIDIPDGLEDVGIPSLIVQPLVENAIKHGIAGARRGGHVIVTASVDAEAHEMRIAVLNSGAPLRGRTPSADGGVGLRNVERRLACYYGDKARLTLSATPDGETLAELRLPVETLEGAETPVLRRGARQ